MCCSNNRVTLMLNIYDLGLLNHGWDTCNTVRRHACKHTSCSSCFVFNLLSRGYVLFIWGHPILCKILILISTTPHSPTMLSVTDDPGATPLTFPSAVVSASPQKSNLKADRIV